MSGKYVFSQALKEVRFHLCQKSDASSATRAFLTRAYPAMKKENPDIPILIREAQGIEPKIWARYEYGHEKVELLGGLDAGGIEGKVIQLVNAN